MHLLTQSALLQALGWTLVNSLWQMGLLWLAYLLVVNIFHQSPSRFRHGLALSLLAFGALGSVLTFTGAYFFDDAGWGFGRSAGWEVLNTGAWGTGNRLITLILPWCSSLYLLVLGVLLLRYSHQYLYTRRLARKGLSKIPAELRIFVESTSRRMGIRPMVSAWRSTLVDVPLTLGSLKPVILLPAAMLTNLSPEQVEAIVIHELAHIRRKDYLLNLGVTVIGLLFFFNPFCRMLIRQLQREREHCCDDEVLQFRYDPHAYVSALLSLARQHRQSRLALAATGEGDDQLLLHRARKILQQKRTDHRPGVRPFIFLFLTAAIAILSLSSPPAGKHPKPTAARTPQAAAPLIGEMVFIPIINTGAPEHTRPARTEPASQKEIAGALYRSHRKTPATGTDGPPPADNPALTEVRMLGSVAGINTRSGPDAGSGDRSAGIEDRPLVTDLLTQPAALTVTIKPAPPRDNSLGTADDDDDAPEQAPDIPPMENLVFVPNSSFSFQNIDTLRPEDKLAWVEEATEREIRTQVVRLQKELAVQLELLRRQEARTRVQANTTQVELKKLLNQQIIIQRDYLHKMDQLHLRLKKATRRLTTVYI
ncbi:M56 family metallopeptidase [Puia sp.]|jgi:beta-lactamase regulating signal transducer with metallopeptidase domain|uniref:M56 family metallopeptidase n=1 Tax=Puia sp. TaxID=2045100 RepID=UPI002F3FF866